MPTKLFHLDALTAEFAAAAQADSESGTRCEPRPGQAAKRETHRRSSDAYSAQGGKAAAPPGPAAFDVARPQPKRSWLRWPSKQPTRLAALQQRVAELERLVRPQGALPLQIEHYSPIDLPGFDQTNRFMVALRSFHLAGVPHFWAVDAESLATRLIPRADFCGQQQQPPATSGYEYLHSPAGEQSPYVKLRRALTESQALENGGLRSGSRDAEGLFLTVDLCPASKPFERSFFQALIDRKEVDHASADVAICISGRWADTHGEDFSWLRQQQQRGALDITWVNHSFSHAYRPGRPPTDNFLLSAGINLLYEIYETERILLAWGLCPSIFFRFPGLVADARCMREMRRLGLLPLGCDAWLAKGQPAVGGSIVLVHGNSNEPAGIDRVMPLVEGANRAALLPLVAAATTLTSIPKAA